jgi:hypothetical protein
MAVSLGFLVENQREHYVEGQREKELAHSLYLETKADSVELANILKFRKMKENYLNFLYENYRGDVEDTLLQKQFQIAQFVGVNANSTILYEPRHAILRQLESSGMLRYFKDEHLQSTILNVINTGETVRTRMQRETDAYHQFVLPVFIKIQNFDLNRKLTENGKINKPLTGLYFDYLHSNAFYVFQKIKPTPAYLVELKKSLEFYRFLLSSTRSLHLKNYQKYNADLLADLRRIYHIH